MEHKLINACWLLNAFKNYYLRNTTISPNINKKLLSMKRIITKWDKLKLGRRLHYLQKRLHRAEANGYQEKIDKYTRYIKEVQEKLKHVKEPVHRWG